MKRPLLAAVLTISCLQVCGQEARDPDEILKQVRAKLGAMTRRLPRYTCVQTVERRYFKHTDHKNPPPSCDQISGDRVSGRRKLTLYATDRLRLDVAVADGREIVAWAGAGKFDSRSIDELVGEGPTGTGAFGGHLVDVFSNAGVHFQYLGEKTANGKNVLEYRYTVPLEASNYRVRGGGDWHLTAYDGMFQIDGESLELNRLEVRTDQLPADTGMCEARNNLEYQRLRIGESDFLLPRQAQLQVVHADASETTNVITFSGCREYHTESTIRFDGQEAEGSSADGKVSAATPTVLPEGLTLSLALTAPIDTSTAAAGDPVSATVTHTIKDSKSKAILVPAGAVARGRIGRMRHRQGGPDDFIILLSFDTLEMGGNASPLFVKLDQLDQLDRARAFARNRRGITAVYGAPETWGALIFPAIGSKYIVPARFEAKWLTVAPK